MNTTKLLLAIVSTFLPSALATAAIASPPSRQTISLNGVWQIAEGKMDMAPEAFSHAVPVPGLVSLATPAFDPAPGPVVVKQRPAIYKDPARDAFWYRRIFRLNGPVPPVARLKVQKAMFGTRVILNGRTLGDNQSSFTPGWFDAREALKPGENELLIRVGADREAVPSSVPSALDYEKSRYYPGIFDSVELILSDTPHFISVQTAPDIATSTVRVQAVLRNDGESGTGPLGSGKIGAGPIRVTFSVREAVSGKVAGRVTSEPVEIAKGAETTVDVRVPVADCRLWSPEDPFLYHLEAQGGGDRFETRFGMREFRFDPGTRRALLNGKTYYIRGSNITLYRFFEDQECRDLPWRADWVRLLHQRVKDMHWNCLRYCIGFPPEAWYEVADELGILIQDEFPFWGDIRGMQREVLAGEYAKWMRERWNHPCVVIWDARNEGPIMPESGAAIDAVRGLDLSNRPWDNGFSAPMSPTDSLEFHVYRSGSSHTLADLGRLKSLPPTGNRVGNDGRHAVVLNEYGWLWLNRDGSPTTVTSNFYRNLCGPDATAAQRRHVCAIHVAAETESFRSYRQAAAVMHFVTLGYSRPGGVTSDNWLDVEKLIWEPEFERYVRDAFAPVGLMLDFWNDIAISGRSVRVPVRLINDLEKPWSGPVALRVRRADGGGALLEQRQDCRLEPLGQATVQFDVSWPAPAGPCVLVAEVPGADGRPVHSIREIALVDAQSLGLAFGKKTSASSAAATAKHAVDADSTTTWLPAVNDQAWLAVDLGKVHTINRVRISCTVPSPAAFTVQASRDGQTWTDIVTETKGGARDIRFSPVEAGHVRIQATNCPAGGNAITIRELQVFE